MKRVDSTLKASGTLRMMIIFFWNLQIFFDSFSMEAEFRRIVRMRSRAPSE